MAVKFFKCAHCGNVIEKLVDSGVPVVCCGEKMAELLPNEECRPNCPFHVTKLDNVCLKIELGSEKEIAFVYVETEKGGIKFIPKDEPFVNVRCNTRPLAAYLYCKQHGLWKKNL